MALVVLDAGVRLATEHPHTFNSCVLFYRARLDPGTMKVAFSEPRQAMCFF